MHGTAIRSVDKVDCLLRPIPNSKNASRIRESSSRDAQTPFRGVRDDVVRLFRAEYVSIQQPRSQSSGISAMVIKSLINMRCYAAAALG